MTKCIFIILLFLCILPTGHSALFEKHSETDTVIYSQLFTESKVVNNCSPPALWEQVPDKFTHFMEEFSCRKTKDPIEHCLCMDRVVSGLSEKNKQELNVGLRNILGFDQKILQQMTEDVTDIAASASFYNLISDGQTDVGSMASCDMALEKIKNSGCENTYNKLLAQINYPKKIMVKGMPITRDFTNQSIVLHILLGKAIDRDDIDFDKVESLSDLTAKMGEGEVQLFKRYTPLTQYLVESENGDPKLNKFKRERFKKLLNTFISNRRAIELINKKLPGQEQDVGMTSPEGLELYKKFMGGFVQAEIKDYCKESFAPNAENYCKKEKENYTKTIAAIDLDLQKYGELLDLNKKKKIILNDDVAVLSMEGLYCSKLSDTIKEGHEKLSSDLANNNCDTPLCQVVKKRIDSGVAKAQVLDELAQIAKMEKTHQIRKFDVAVDDKNSSNEPINNRERAKDKKELRIDMEDVFSHKMGYSREQVAKAFNEVKKSHPEIVSNAIKNSPAVHAEQGHARAQQAAQTWQQAQHYQPQQMRQSLQQTNNGQFIPAADRSSADHAVAPKQISTVRMFPMEQSAVEAPRKSRPARSDKFTQELGTDKNVELERLKEELAQVKTELGTQDDSTTSVSAPVKKGTLATGTVVSERSEVVSAIANTAARSRSGNRMESVGARPFGESPSKSVGGVVMASNSAPAVPAAIGPENRAIQLSASNKSVYELTVDELEMLKRNPKLIQEKFKNNGSAIPEIFTVSDGHGGQKFLKAIYLAGTDEGHQVELREMDKSELCQAKILNINCDTMPAEENNMPAKRQQLFRLKDLEDVIEKSTKNPELPINSNT